MESSEDDLFSLDDVKVEVMRARGAGGQVSASILARQPH
jgi:protein subunit release factor A